MVEEDIGVEDLAANQGIHKDNSKKWRPGRAELIIVLIYTLAGPPIGVFWTSIIALFVTLFTETEKFLDMIFQLPLVTIVLIPFSYLVAILPAAVTGFFVAVFCTNSRYCFAASIISPVIVNTTMIYFDLSYLGMINGAGKYTTNYLNILLVAGILSSATLFFLIAPIRKRA